MHTELQKIILVFELKFTVREIKNSIDGLNGILSRVSEERI